MPKNTIFSFGSIALIDKIGLETTFFTSVLGGISGRSSSFLPLEKLLISNKLNQSVSINKILEFAPVEILATLGFKGTISDQSLYRDLERLGERQRGILDQYQRWIQQQNLLIRHR